MKEPLPTEKTSPPKKRIQPSVAMSDNDLKAMEETNNGECYHWPKGGYETTNEGQYERYYEGDDRHKSENCD